MNGKTADMNAFWYCRFDDCLYNLHMLFDSMYCCLRTDRDVRNMSVDDVKDPSPIQCNIWSTTGYLIVQKVVTAGRLRSEWVRREWRGGGGVGWLRGCTL